MRYSREVVVGWRDQLEPDRTHVRAFELALDFQTITSIRQFEDVYEELTTMHIITSEYYYLFPALRLQNSSFLILRTNIAFNPIFHLFIIISC